MRRSYELRARILARDICKSPNHSLENARPLVLECQEESLVTDRLKLMPDLIVGNTIKISVINRFAEPPLFIVQIVLQSIAPVSDQPQVYTGWSSMTGASTFAAAVAGLMPWYPCLKIEKRFKVTGFEKDEF